MRTAATPPEVLAALHGFVRKIGKVPVMLQDGSPGFLVNAALAEYFREAEALYREGTPLERIDDVMRERVFPLGPFEVADQAGRRRRRRDVRRDRARRRRHRGRRS